MSKSSETAFFATSALGVFGLTALKHGKFKGKVHHFVMTHTVQSDKDTQAIAACIEEKYAGKTEVLQGDHLVVQQHKFRAPAKPIEPPTPRTSVLGLDRLAKEKREAAAALERSDHKRSRRDDDPVGQP